MTSQLTNGENFLQAWVGTNDGDELGDGYSYGDYYAAKGGGVDFSLRTAFTTWKLFNADLNNWE